MTGIISCVFLFFSISGLAIESTSATEPSNNTVGDFSFIDEKLRAACESGLNLVEALQEGPLRAELRERVSAAATLGKGRFFNPSITAYKEGYFIAVRFILSEDEYSAIRPGNNRESRFEKGSNFWWVDWNSNDFKNVTLYFIADVEFSNVKLMVPWDITNRQWYLDGDIKAHVEDGDLFAVNAHSPEFVAQISFLMHPNFGLRFLKIKGMTINKFPNNNFGIIKVTKETCLYLDWFYKEGVKLVRINNSNGTQDSLMFSYRDGYEFDGLGSSLKDNHDNRHAGLMPLMSFGTPHIFVDDVYLGVGHAKIMTDSEQYPYQNDSHIELFRDQINGPLKEMLKNKLIRHDAYSSKSNQRKGYHYLMYFYFIKMNEDGIVEMKLSDAFLPLNQKQLQTKTDYVFSLVFPAGITRHQTSETDALISAGIGDYSAAVFTLPLSWIIESCRHDVSAMDFSDYRYNFLVFDNQGLVHIRSTISAQ